MDESQRVLFARLLCSSQLSHFGDVMVFISRPVERGGGSSWKPSSRIWEQRQHSAAPARETGCNVTPAQDPDSCYDPKHNLFRVWPAPTVNNHSRRVECQPPDTQCVKTRSGRSFTYKNTVQAAKLCRKSQWEVYLEQTIRNRSHPEVFSEGLDPVFPCCHKKKRLNWERESAAIQIHPADSLSVLFPVKEIRRPFRAHWAFVSPNNPPLINGALSTCSCGVKSLRWKRILVLFGRTQVVKWGTTSRHLAPPRWTAACCHCAADGGRI